MKEGPKLVCIGSIGYDIYITGLNNRIICEPGGFAWHFSSGMLGVAKTCGTVLANISDSLNSDIVTSRFLSSGVNVHLSRSSDRFHNLYVFDMNKRKYTEGIAYSEGKIAKPFSSLLFEQKVGSFHAHIGTTNPEDMLERIRDIKSHFPQCTASTNLYLPYVKSNLETISKLIQISDVIFINYEEYSVLKESGAMKSMALEKLICVTCGKTGVIAFYNGSTLFSIVYKAKKEVCAIGAGDVFTGAFLSSYLQDGSIAKALLLGSKLASASVSDYGTSHIPKGTTINSSEIVKSLFNKPKMFLCSNFSSFDADKISMAGSYFVIILTKASQAQGTTFRFEVYSYTHLKEKIEMAQRSAKGTQFVLYDVYQKYEDSKVIIEFVYTDKELRQEYLNTGFLRGKNLLNN